MMRPLGVTLALGAAAAAACGGSTTRFQSNMTYPSAGSFVHFLIETQGLALLQAYFRLATFDAAPAVTESRFQSAYGRPLASLWDEWRAGRCR